MALYKEHGINPFSSFLLLLIQLPILIALYWAVRSGLGSGTITGLYSFVPVPQTINTIFLGFINIARPSIVIILLAAVAQYFQARLAIYKNPTGTRFFSGGEDRPPDGLYRSHYDHRHLLRPSCGRRPLLACFVALFGGPAILRE